VGVAGGTCRWPDRTDVTGVAAAEHCGATGTSQD
jgi:hypothetical protein